MPAFGLNMSMREVAGAAVSVLFFSSSFGFSVGLADANPKLGAFLGEASTFVPNDKLGLAASELDPKVFAGAESFWPKVKPVLTGSFRSDFFGTANPVPKVKPVAAGLGFDSVPGLSGVVKAKELLTAGGPLCKNNAHYERQTVR